MIGSKRQRSRSHGRRKFTESLHANERRQKDNKVMIRIAELMSLQDVARDSGRYFDVRARRIVLSFYNQLLTLRTRKHSNA